MKSRHHEILRYGLNGLVATAVHYTVLTVNVTVLDFRSAGLANFVAALFGLTASFLGSYHFVFRPVKSNILSLAIRFFGLYCAFSVLHGMVLWIWSDRLGLDFRFGFLLATALQVMLSYFGNKYIVFR